MILTSYSAAGKEVFSLWEGYKKERSSTNFTDLAACLEKSRDSFAAGDRDLIEEISKDEFTAAKIDPEEVKKIHSLTQNILFRTEIGLFEIQPRADLFKVVVPEEIQTLIINNLSLKDLARLLLVDKLRGHIVSEVVVRKVEEASEKIDLPMLLSLVKVYGLKIRNLNLYKLLNQAVTANQVARILKQCPNLQKFVVCETPSIPELATVLKSHFAEESAKSSLTHFALIAPNLCWHEGNYNASRLDFLETTCHLLEMKVVQCVLEDWSGAPLVYSLKPWLDKGKDVFLFHQILGSRINILATWKTARNTSTPAENVDFFSDEGKLLYMVPPDWYFLQLTPEQRANIRAHANQMVSTFTQYLQRLDEFTQLPTESQNRLLTQLNNASIREKIQKYQSDPQYLSLNTIVEQIEKA